MITRIAVCLSIALALFVSPAEATPIRYTLSAVGSGTLGGQSFSLAPFTITSIANTNQIVTESPTLFTVLSTATLALSGFPTTSFPDQTRNFVLTSSRAAGIDAVSPADNGFADVVDGFTLSGLSKYHLDTSIGPTVGVGAVNAGKPFRTNAGDFILNSVGNVTFQATLIPEPSSAALLVIGCVVVAVVARRR